MLDFASHYPWLIPALPLAACILIALLGTKLKGLAHIPAILAMLGSTAIALTLLVGISNGSIDVAKQLTNIPLFDWISVNNFHVPVAITIDQLTALYLSFITGIGLLIFVYAAGYMKGDYGYWRFFAYLSIFVFFMTVLVMGNNFILLYLGWEGVGLASYLLIGYYYPRPSAVAAAKKAFITNRIGDFGLAIGVFLIYTYFGSVEYSTVFAKLHDTQFLATFGPMLKYIPFCIMLGAFGKSAQFPLHVWLPDAMEGPTPVSALIHAATMVTAGIYLIARTMPLFLMDPTNHTALNVVAVIGGITAFLAASIALCQYDLKKIWAYSTLSQLGYMFMGLGVLASTSAVFHVFTHAFFKALLFLSAGSVMHAMGGELDIRKMSGVRRVMPITNICMLIGCLALAGVPGLAGFFSKDEIISHAINAPEGPGFYLGILGLLVAFMTAFYTFRLYFKVFLGPLELPPTAGHHEPSPFALADAHAHAHAAHAHEELPRTSSAHAVDTVHAPQGHEEASHGHDDHAHAPNDGSPLMWIPLLILCIGAIGAGYLGFKGTGDWFHHFLNPALSPITAVAESGDMGVSMGAHAASVHTGVEAAEPAERVSETVLLTLGFILPLAGIAVAFYFFKLNRHAAAIVGANLKPLVNFLYNKWYIDDIYRVFLIKPLWIFAHLLSGIDRFVIDGLVFFVGFVPQIVGYSLKPTQRGVLQRYAVGMIAGLAAVILGVMYLLRT